MWNKINNSFNGKDRKWHLWYERAKKLNVNTHVLNWKHRGQSKGVKSCWCVLKSQLASGIPYGNCVLTLLTNFTICIFRSILWKKKNRTRTWCNKNIWFKCENLKLMWFIIVAMYYYYFYLYSNSLVYV
jgi:hypothetical protein